MYWAFALCILEFSLHSCTKKWKQLKSFFSVRLQRLKSDFCHFLGPENSKGVMEISGYEHLILAKDLWKGCMESRRRDRKQVNDWPGSRSWHVDQAVGDAKWLAE